MFYRVLIIFTFFILLSPKTFANSHDSIINNVFTLIYNNQFIKADSVLSSQKNQIDTFYFDILQLDLYWWKYISKKSKNDYHQLTFLLKKFSSQNSAITENKIKQLITLSYKLRLELKKYNIIKIAIIRIKIKRLLKSINREDLPYNQSRLNLFDLYKTLFCYFDNLFNPFFFETKRNNRIAALESLEKFTANNDIVVNTMAHYFLGRIYVTLENKSACGKIHFEKLVNNYPQNTFFIKLVKNCEKKH
jgi:hypothetical protein